MKRHLDATSWPTLFSKSSAGADDGQLIPDVRNLSTPYQNVEQKLEALLPRAALSVSLSSIGRHIRRSYPY